MSESVRSPIVSVVMPVYDCERYVGEALTSILDQTRPPDEVIVVDDGSTDASAQIVENFAPSIRLIRQEHRGAGAARNTGLAVATGNVLALCDADDLWVPQKLERQLEVLASPPASAAVAVFCGMTEFLSPDVSVDEHVGRAPIERIDRSRLISCLMMSRPVFEAVGPFEEHRSEGDWLPWCAKLVDSGAEVRFAEGMLVRRRLHLTNMSLGSSGRSQLWTTALHARIKRRREQE